MPALLFRLDVHKSEGYIKNNYSLLAGKHSKEVQVFVKINLLIID